MTSGPTKPFSSAMAAQTPSGITIEEVKDALPAHLRSSVTSQLVQNLNSISNDPLVAEHIRENFMSYSKVLKEGKFKTEDYLNAVAYVSYKVMGYTNEEAYARTFPQRYSALVAKGVQKKEISSYVSAYNKGRLVNLILEQTLVPTWVLNQDIHQKAINRLADLMVNASSEKVQSDSAAALLTHLKKPETAKVQIDATISDTSGMKEMRELMEKLAERQQDIIKEGKMKTIDIASERLLIPEE